MRGQLLVTVALAWILGFGCADPAGDDDLTGDDDTTAADDDDTAGDDDDTVTSHVWEMPLGMAFGDEEFRGQAFLDDLTALGTTRIQNNIWWCQFEPTDDDYHYTLTDAFVDEIDEDTHPLLRINARGCHWPTTAESGHTVPTDLAIGGDYYEFVYEVVARAAGRVELFENDWEVDELVNWEGTPGEYAQMMRTFHRAVLDAAPHATVVCGGSWADLDADDQLFFHEVFEDLDADGEDLPFHLFDIHAYQDPHLVPELLDTMRATLDAHPETAGIPMIASEFGGPTPLEFRDRDVELYDQLIEELRDDIALLGGDLSSTPLQPDGYPDYLRMFAFGVEPDLDVRRDRIQVRQLVQRSLAGMAGGLVAQHWWNLVAERSTESIDAGVYFRHFTFGKLTLNVPDPDPGGMEFTPQPVHGDFARNLAWLNSCASVRRVDTGRNLMWLYEVGRTDGSTAYVVWEQRDPFGGEDEPAVEVAFAVPWDAATAHDAFDEPVEVAVEEGVARLAITGTPVFVEP